MWLPQILTQLNDTTTTQCVCPKCLLLRSAYLECIGEQLRDALNDMGRLGIIYQGLSNYIFAKNGRTQNIPRITNLACIRSPITRTLYLLKHVAGTHLRSNQIKFPLSSTKLETDWITQAQLQPAININLCHHFFNKLILHHITSLAQLTLPNGTQLMTNAEYQA
jgi:hypothetical protein